MCFRYHLGAVILCDLYFTAIMAYHGACSLRKLQTVQPKARERLRPCSASKEVSQVKVKPKERTLKKDHKSLLCGIREAVHPEEALGNKPE